MITLRDLRQRWPEAEAALQAEDEILITRNSKPVAKLVRFVPPARKRKRWNPEEHRKWVKKVFGNKVFPRGQTRPVAKSATLRVQVVPGPDIPDGLASAPERGRPALSLAGSPAPGGHGRIENLALDDAR